MRFFRQPLFFLSLFLCSAAGFPSPAEAAPLPPLLEQLKKTNYLYLSRQPVTEASPGDTLFFTNLVRKGKYNVAGKPLLIAFSYPVSGTLRGVPFRTNRLRAFTDRFGAVNFSLQVSLPPNLPAAFPSPATLHTRVFFLHSTAGHTEHVNSLSLTIVNRTLAQQLLMLFFLLLALGVGGKLFLLSAVSSSPPVWQSHYGALSPWFHWRAKAFAPWSFLTAAVFSLSLTFAFAVLPPVAFVLLALTLFFRPPLMESLILQALLLFFGGYLLMQYAPTHFFYSLLSTDAVRWIAVMLSLALPTPLFYLMLLVFAQQLDLPASSQNFLAQQIGLLFLFSCVSSGFLYWLLFLRRAREGHFDAFMKR